MVTEQQIGRIIAKAWADEAFKQQLIADPTATLAAEGITVPAGMTVRVVESTDTDIVLALPRKPTDELSDETLDGITGGKDACFVQSSY